MPSLDPRFIQVDQTLQSYFVDKDTGAPLSAGIVTFYEENNKTVLKPVYELSVTPSNQYVYTQLANPLILSSVGTFIDENGNDIIPYYFPYTPGYDGTVQPPATLDLYYVTVYSAEGVFQFSRDAVPNLSPAGMINPAAEQTDNLLTNPQFAIVNFNGVNTNAVINVTGTNTVTNLAPDWNLITTGAGTVTVQQIAVAGSNLLPTNPAYLLDITSSSLSALTLQQRLYHDTNLLFNGIAAGSFVIGSQDGAAHNIIMTYQPSTQVVPNSGYVLLNVTTPSSGFMEYQSPVGIPISPTFNQDSSITGYTDVLITIPPGAHIQITSIQVLGLPTITTPFVYTETTTNQQINDLFHDYYASILIEPKNSVLTGWNFALNPFQFNATAVTNTTSQTQYIADQTIIHTTGAAGSVATGEASAANRTCLTVNGVGGQANNQFALIQYVDASTIRPYWSYFMSSLARARIFTSNGTSLGLKCRLIYSTSVPGTLSNVEPISSWAGADPTFSGAWTAIKPLNDPVYILPNAYSSIVGSDAFTPFPFNGMQLPIMTSNTMTLGIVLYTTGNMNTADTVVFDRVSLVPNYYAIDETPKTFNQVLSECEFYYEKSYPYNVLKGDITGVGAITTQMGVVFTPATSQAVRAKSFNLAYRTTKRSTNPALILYSANTGVALNVYVVLATSGGANVASADIVFPNFFVSGYGFGNNNSSRGGSFFASNPASMITGTSADPAAEAFLTYQYTGDARLGLIP